MMVVVVDGSSSSVTAIQLQVAAGVAGTPGPASGLEADDGPEADATGVLPKVLLGCSGHLVSRLINGPYGAYHGLLFGLVWDTNWSY